MYKYTQVVSLLFALVATNNLVHAAPQGTLPSTPGTPGPSSSAASSARLSSPVSSHTSQTLGGEIKGLSSVTTPGGPGTLSSVPPVSSVSSGSGGIPDSTHTGLPNNVTNTKTPQVDAAASSVTGSSIPLQTAGIILNLPNYSYAHETNANKSQWGDYGPTNFFLNFKGSTLNEEFDLQFFAPVPGDNSDDGSWAFSKTYTTQVYCTATASATPTSGWPLIEAISTSPWIAGPTPDAGGSGLNVQCS